MTLQNIENDLNSTIQDCLANGRTAELSGQPLQLWHRFEDLFLNSKEKAFAGKKYALRLECFLHGQKLPTIAIQVRLAAAHPASILLGNGVFYRQDIFYVHRKKAKKAGPNGYSGLLTNHVELAEGVQPNFDLDGLCTYFSDKIDVRCKPILESVKTIDRVMGKVSLEDMASLIQAIDKLNRYFPLNLLYSEEIVQRNPTVWAHSVLNPAFRAELLKLWKDEWE